MTISAAIDGKGAYAHDRRLGCAVLRLARASWWVFLSHEYPLHNYSREAIEVQRAGVMSLGCIIPEPTLALVRGLVLAP